MFKKSLIAALAIAATAAVSEPASASTGNVALSVSGPNGHVTILAHHKNGKKGGNHYRGRGHNPYYGVGHVGPAHHYRIPRGVIRRKLRRHHIAQVSPIRYKRGRYRVVGIGPRGAELRFVFDAYSGHLLRVRVLSYPYRGWRPPHHLRGYIAY